MSDAKADTPAKKPKGKLILVAVLGLVLAAGGGGGAWYAMSRKASDGDGEEHAAEVKKKHAAKPLFTTLEPFTVNLNDPRGDRFAQVGVTLQFEDPHVEAEIKDRLPAVRNAILLLISSKQIEELLTTEGKQKLAEEIRLRSGRALGLDLPDPEPDAAAAPAAPAKAAAEAEDDEAPKPKKAKARRKKAPEVENPITQVLFSQFIVQ